MTLTPGEAAVRHVLAAQHLVAARTAGKPGDRLPESCRPSGMEDALAIQGWVTAMLRQPVGGWKCSLPSDGKLPAAPIYAPSISLSSPCRVLTNGLVAKIEPEIAFVLGKDLGPRPEAYTEEDVRAAIAETRLVLELVGCRYADPEPLSFAEMLADGLNNQGLFVGPPVGRALNKALGAFPVTVKGPSGTLFTFEGQHPCGHPLAPLCWLANFLAGRGEGLMAGQIVTTGSYCGVIDAPLETPLRVIFGSLGSLTVHFKTAC